MPLERGGLLVAWHPNGLVDPALLLATFPGRAVFGARHGLFRWPVLGALLRATAVPIYRRQDLAPGGESAAEAAAKRGNEAGLAALADAVARRSFAVLFPEGDSHDLPHPIELRTGAARLLLSARERSGDRADRFGGPAVVPVGLHYDRKRLFRSRALVVYHPPLDLSEELEAARAAGDDEERRREVARRLTARFAAALEESALATADWEEHHLMHRLRRLLRAERAARAGAPPGPSDMRERRLGFERVRTAFRVLRERVPAEVEALRVRIRDYDRRLRRLGVDDHELDGDPEPVHASVLLVLAFQRFVVDLLLPPLVAIGLIANLPAAILVAGVARAGSKREKDVASLKLLVGAVLFPLGWVVLGVLAARGHGAIADLYPDARGIPWATGLLAVALSALGGALVLAYGRISRRWGRALVVRWRRATRRRDVASLLAERASLADAAASLSEGLELPGGKWGKW